jgi:hypothetical protein
MYVNACNLGTQGSDMLEHRRLQDCSLATSHAVEGSNTDSQQQPANRLLPVSTEDAGVLSSLCSALDCACVNGRELGPGTAAARLC